MIGWQGRAAVTTLGLALFVLLTQAGALTREVIDWDESTFILLAGRLLDGQLPYADLFDNKPPLIFFQLAAVMAVFGEHLLSVRLFGDACILAIALLTIASVRHFVPPGPAVLSGVLLVAIFAIWPGQYTSTELPAMAMIMGALAVLLRARDRGWAIATAGMLISLATLTRTNLAVVAVVVGVWITLAGLVFPQIRVRPLAFVLYTVAGLVPVFAFVALYWHAGALDEFILATVTVPLSYAENQNGMMAVLAIMLEGWVGMARWAPLWMGSFTFLTVAGAMTLLLQRPSACSATRQDLSLVCSFAAAVLVSVLMSGVGYMHYWLHILPFAAMLTAPFLAWAWARPVRRLLVLGLVSVTVLSSLRHTVPAAVRLVTTPDILTQSWTVRAAAGRIGEVLQPEDEIWALDAHLILWYLGKPPVSRVAAHPNNITRASIIGPLIEAGYVEADVLNRIYDSHPAFIVTNGYGAPSFLLDGPRDFEAYLRESYAVFFETGDVVVYRRLGHGGWGREK